MSTEFPLPRVGITLGDPRGIGPEIVIGALADPQLKNLATYTVIGPTGTAWPGADLVTIGSWSPNADAAQAGRLAGLAIERGVELALGGSVDALVTAPIDKAAFHAGGWDFPGHTEMLGALSDSPIVGMMMAAEKTKLGGPLRVVLATTHLPLRDVPHVLTTELLVAQTKLTARALRDWWGIPNPRIALCAFNPHASDQGLFGDEEARIYEPALFALGGAGVQAIGPIPADTVFGRSLAGEFDAVIAPYHDVGMAAFKTASFGSGVNVTLGLPFPRTSPDHGTALDIAGKGLASASSMIESILMAVRLAGRVESQADIS